MALLVLISLLFLLFFSVVGVKYGTLSVVFIGKQAHLWQVKSKTMVFNLVLGHVMERELVSSTLS